MVLLGVRSRVPSRPPGSGPPLLGPVLCVPPPPPALCLRLDSCHSLPDGPLPPASLSPMPCPAVARLISLRPSAQCDLAQRSLALVAPGTRALASISRLMIRGGPGAAVDTDEASPARPPLVSCCAAQFPSPGPRPRSGDPLAPDNTPQRPEPSPGDINRYLTHLFYSVTHRGKREPRSRAVLGTPTPARFCPKFQLPRHFLCDRPRSRPAC